jgi:hypothetical protein
MIFGHSGRADAVTNALEPANPETVLLRQLRCMTHGEQGTLLRSLPCHLATPIS